MEDYGTIWYNVVEDKNKKQKKYDFKIIKIIIASTITATATATINSTTTTRTTGCVKSDAHVVGGWLTLKLFYG